MVNDTVQNTTRAVHDVGLAAWLGGQLFGKVALNPAVRSISDKRERGEVANKAWNGYNLVNSAGLGAATVGYVAARATELKPSKQTGAEKTLTFVQDGVLGAAVLSSIINGIQGARLMKQAPNGAVPVEDGTTPAPETPDTAARIQKSLGPLGNLNILLGTALVSLNAIQSRLHYSRPAARRALFRRS
jgi:hypothetical protein